MTRRALKSKALRFLVYRAWKTADDPLVRPIDIARATGLKPATVSHVLAQMRLQHNMSPTHALAGTAGRLAVDHFMRFTERGVVNLTAREM